MDPSPPRPPSASPAGAVASGRAGQRLLSLDVLRGITVAGMLLVNDPGNGDSVYTPLRHADWNGWTSADLVFPFFLFIVGITTHLSLTSRAACGASDGGIRRQILRRASLLFLIGFALNWFPFYQFGAIAGHPSATFLDRVVARLEVVRMLGILQRIALAYFVAALLTWRVDTKRVVAIIIAIVVGYWILMTLVPVPGEGTLGMYVLADPARNLAAWVDRWALDWSRWGLGNHLWNGTVVYDPEGVLSTIPAIGTTMLGVLAGRLLAGARALGSRINGLIAGGVLGVAAGLCWSLDFPINKRIWTSSYVLFTAGMACLTLAAIMWLVDVRHRGGWTKPFAVYGTNAIVAFVGSELMAILLSSTIRVPFHGHGVGATTWVYEQFARVLAPKTASALYAFLFTAAWYPMLRALHRRGIIIRI